MSLPTMLSEFVDRNRLLRSLYGIYEEDSPSIDHTSTHSLCIFVMEFLSRGRKDFVFQILIERKLQRALSWPDHQGHNIAMLILCAQAGLALQGDRLRAWYYFQALPRYGLGILIGDHDLALLARRLPGGGPPTDFHRLKAIAADAGWLGPESSAFASHIADMCASRSALELPTVSIVGFHGSVLGLGEDARCLHDCLSSVGLCAELVDVSPPGLEAHGEAGRYRPFTAPRPTGSVVVFCMPLFETMRAMARLDLRARLPDQRWVGYWPWETTAHPSRWHFAYEAVDELWASSTFLKGVFEAETDRPSIHVPLHVRVEEPSLGDDLRDLFAGSFSFLNVFDFNSRIERKNPQGAIEAFRRAFPRGDEPVRLVLKTLHAAARPRDLEALRTAMGGDGRVVIVDGALSKAELCGMIASADVYLSLHRSVGFGRPIAEAMLLGTTVIATGWSGCADFVTDATAFPVRSTLRPVGPHEYPFAAGFWAEPDIDHAAALMRGAYQDPGACEARAARAKTLAQRSFGREPVAARLRDRLAAIGRDLACAAV